jgi:hypothetical protein
VAALVVVVEAASAASPEDAIRGFQMGVKFVPNVFFFYLLCGAGSSRATVPDGNLMVVLVLSIMSLTKMDLNLKANIFLDLGIQDGLLWTRNGLGFSK